MGIKMKLIKKILCVFLTLAVVFLPLTAFAGTKSNDTEECHTYTYWDGSTIEYYLDKDGNPYIFQNNQKLEIIFPDSHFVVTDPELLAELNKFSDSIKKQGEIKSPPTNYVDLSTNPNYMVSPTDTFAADFDAYGAIGSSYYKYNTSHATLSIQTSNYTKKAWYNSPLVTLYVYYYDIVNDSWSGDTYNDINFTGINGKVILFSPALTPYGKITITSSYLSYTDVNVKTLPSS